MTFSMPRETVARLRDAAAARGTDLQGIIKLAVAEWLARQTPISEVLRSRPAWGRYPAFSNLERNTA
jgi:hypothetical protein